MFTCMVVDDEELARERLTRLIDQRTEWKLVAEADSYADAKQLLQDLRPQVCFMDVEIIGGSGIKLATELSPVLNTRWVFTTAYAQHAHKAFEIEADDYLLKPFDDERFNAILEKLRKRLVLSGPHRDILAVRSSGNVQFIKTSDIVWIKGAGNYLELHCQNRTYLHRESLTSIEQYLNPASFVRIHRSAIINIHYLSAINSELGRYSTLEMANKDEVRIGHTYRKPLFQMLGLDIGE
ncbi:LytTR family transcriptional regulator DNA-binding domain-containing protein [Bowmanella denitrificans]|uniref:LytTR family transcriptional regulator DNA-binding domain-containing protein n=1 Tax=Bowmanella denitrificans TaxID=366582 RepID=A0ABN0WJA4_9ALTE